MLTHVDTTFPSTFDHQYIPFTLICPPWKSACYVKPHESRGTLGFRQNNPELETNHTEKSSQIHLRRPAPLKSSPSEVPDTQNHGKVVYKRHSAGITIACGATPVWQNGVYIYIHILRIYYVYLAYSHIAIQNLKVSHGFTIFLRNFQTQPEREMGFHGPVGS